MEVTLQNIKNTIDQVVHETTIVDMHTHIFPPSFGPNLLWGIDELLTYHYLVAEVMRAAPMPYETFWAMTKTEQADLIWKQLFVERAPISEACRGVVTVIQSLGLDPAERDLGKIREYFKEQDVESYVELVFEKANISYAVMTNDPFDNNERPYWEQNAAGHPRFRAALRMDPLLMNWDAASGQMRKMGYDVSSAFNDSCVKQVLRFLEDWTGRMNPLYMAVSLPPSFVYPDDSVRTQIIDRCILPFARERNMPFAMMIGVKKLINPGLELAGDSVGRTDLQCLENLCLKNPSNKFLITLLSRENQHELCVIARKFNNLLPFGCWWFMNNPSIIDEITRQRMELLGWSFVPQHSDARVLDQLLYKWTHSRRLIANVLTDKYSDILNAGWTITEQEIRRDVKRLFQDNFEGFVTVNG